MASSMKERISHEGVVALLQPALKAVHHGKPVRAVLLGLRLVAADDVVYAACADLLHEQLGLAAGALNQKRREW